MQNKLHINLSQGIIDVEGEAELVRAVYEDFKERLLSVESLEIRRISSTSPVVATAIQSTPSAKQKKRTSTKKKPVTSDTTEVAYSADFPKRDKNLDTAKLLNFYQNYEPVSAPEKILIFLKFLTEELGITKPNTDQVYTCFLDVREKPPQAFAQAFRDASAKKGFINFNSADDVVITTKGNNHFEFDLKRK